MHFKSIILIVLFVCNSEFVKAQLVISKDSVFFKKHLFVADSDSLPYRLASPEKLDQNKKYPLIIFLHGADERGNDNTIQLVNGATEFANAANRKKHSAYVLVPQCPKKKRWCEVSWKLASHKQPDTISVPLRMVMDLIGALKDSLPIDSCRIYIAGVSMGGFGTWDAITRYPDLFAAALPVCGGGDETQAAKIKNLPLWAFHGDKDKAVMISRSTNMVEAVRRAGNKHAKLTIYQNTGHNSWTPTFSNPAVYEWLFKQRKQ